MSKYINLLNEEVKEKIEAYIIENGLKPYDSLPSERKLAEMFQVNRLTVRSALKRLRYEHHIVTRHGKGNFIAPPKIDDDTEKFCSFTDGWSADGFKTSSKVIFFDRKEASLSVSSHLGISLGEKVYCLGRVRYLEDEPFLVETSFIPEKYCPGLEQYNFAVQSLYDTLINIYHLNLKRIDETITITTLTNDESHYLKAEENDIGFCIKSTTYDEEKIIEYCITINRADRYMMVSTLGNGEN
ncbi:GntR family transcriptional regulator [Anaerostipes sp.]|uniref:GntR family transcriptional regulator n=1 Tax=Anaerostipes sp. TaxID=1872530 RepID=UPI0025B9CE5A|nr:GntR family transcriptional regulator [Anaerostipes sp.]MBS7009133.1 GntR family transcriptional regulator [Anaerostipes sp.]